MTSSIIDNIMRQEILQQPEVCERLFRREAPGLEKVVQRFRKKPPVGICLVARGSSDHAATYARYLLEVLTGIPTFLAAPSVVTTFGARPNYKNYVVIGVSQSGQGPDTNITIKEAKKKGAFAIGITNDPKSGLAKISDHVVHLGAEKEKAIAATKTYSSELAALALLGVMWGGSKKQVSQLSSVPDLMEHTLRETESAVDKAARRLKSLNSCVVVGRGYQLGNAHEMGLKLKECAGVPALSYSTADFLHGPVQLAQKNFPVFMLSSPGHFEKEMADYTRDYLRRGASVFRLGLKDSKFKSLPDHVRLDTSMTVKADIDEALAPLLTILPAQWFAFYNAVHKGLDPAMPTGLKKVTKTK